MTYEQSVKYVTMEPTSVTNGGTASLLIDRLGYDYATIKVDLGSGNTVSNVPSVISISEADVTNTTSFVAIAGFTTAMVPAAIATSAVTVSLANVDCKIRKRYLRLLVNPVTTQVISATAILSRPEQTPTTASGQGVAVSLIG